MRRCKPQRRDDTQFTLRFDRALLRNGARGGERIERMTALGVVALTDFGEALAAIICIS